MDSQTGFPISLLSALKNGLAYDSPGMGLAVNQDTGMQDKNKNVTLKDLLDAGLIKPGEGNVTLSYRGVTYTANLVATGLIEFQGSTYDSPDAFSLRAKQLQLPDRESDNGWRSVLVDGVVLEDVRYAYLKGKRDSAKASSKVEEKPNIATVQGSDLPILPSSLEVPLDSLVAEAAPEGAADAGAAEAAQQNWVQCSRCEAWRIVPDEFWPDVDAAGDEDWYCNEATWDVTQYEPYTPPCK
ncbi:hypothetical protein DUNSADRAFT_5408 [Dunaliella salina]|uniref:CW-type domain-containing protein n=1 Tax=Dunaliella salina TaxID=3046 RepID=A0ABQ7GQB1_DUNSA|nr:hypothetical protein DUNSADRAFT_5408 [Dunaliella salina]|eukprot:KAF5836781.1 hypothetical protein DUNSADRAFT_5408 [Dunaliella salina]